ncbi:lipocalin family protein [Dyella japonica]|uniref:Lipocalin-like domain-containing protein n=1 Tax=Dyella japonica TaxID=231455 RepID=A0ABV2K176_9GAMM
MKKLYGGLAGLALAGALAALVGMLKLNVWKGDMVLSGAAVTRSALIGDWVEPVPGTAGQVQGFLLREDGSVSSINMATLLYGTWRLDNDTLTLTGASLGNHSASAFENTYKVESVGQRRLRLVDAAGHREIFSKY